MSLRFFTLPLSLMAAFALAGCQSSEDKAEAYFQSGLALLGQGDEDRAMVEFRNVFQLDGFHAEARATYAALLVGRGELTEGYGQYLRLIEQYPDTFTARRDLARMAVARGNWAEVERHGRAAITLAPEDPTSRALGVALAYRAASIARDEPGRKVAAEAAATLLAEVTATAGPGPDGLPDHNQIARRVLIDWRISGPSPEAALPDLEAAIAAEPGAIDFHLLKLRLLLQTGDDVGTGAHLQRMIALFPDNAQVRGALISWFLSQDDIDGAEALLRAQAGDATGNPEGHAAVIQLLQTARGTQAARDEMERLLSANAGTPNADLYGAMIAGLDFEAGKRSEAIAALETILKGATASDQTLRLKIAQAQMLDATGNRVGARARIEEVLAEDATNVEALKLRASWRILADDPGGAIVDLRAALNQSPRDASILTLMAEAHERDGADDLSSERLSLAVEMSNNGSEESLRYAKALMRDGRTQGAVAVLMAARRANRTDYRLAAALASIHIGDRDWSRAAEMADALRALPEAAAASAARDVDTAVLLGQDRLEEGLAALSEQIGAEGDGRPVAATISAMAQAGRMDEARTYLDGLQAGRPGDRDLMMISAGLDTLRGQAAMAEAQYRALIVGTPGAEAPVRMLYGLLLASGRNDEAVALIDTALVAAPGSALFRWMKAGHLEQAGDVDGAIGIYGALYAEDSTNAVIANNLASLISARRDDAESLERAFAVARRLRGSKEPAFADTYGWIEFRRGNLDEALRHLEPAAEGLPDDPLVQYHLARAYDALGRTDDARRRFALAIEVAGNESPLPQIADAKTRLTDLGGPLGN